MFGRALSRRIKATVLYATETGRSEQYAKQLVELLGHAFNAKVSQRLRDIFFFFVVVVLFLRLKAVKKVKAPVMRSFPCENF